MVSKAQRFDCFWVVSDVVRMGGPSLSGGLERCTKKPLLPDCSHHWSSARKSSKPGSIRFLDIPAKLSIRHQAKRWLPPTRTFTLKPRTVRCPRRLILFLRRVLDTSETCSVFAFTLTRRAIGSSAIHRTEI